MLGVGFFFSSLRLSFIFSLDYEHHLILLQEITATSFICSLLAVSWNLILKNKQGTQTQLCFLIQYIQGNVFFSSFNHPLCGNLSMRHISASLLLSFSQLSFSTDFYEGLFGVRRFYPARYRALPSSSLSSLGTDQCEDG